MDDFDGDSGSGPAVDGTVDGTHAAGADAFEQPVMSQMLAGASRTEHPPQRVGVFGRDDTAS